MYPVYKLEELKLLHVLKFKPERQDAAQVWRGGSLKEVMVRRYNPESKNVSPWIYSVS
jgi:hypothetical protein